MKKFLMLKSVLLIVVINLLGCDKVPPFPEVWQCAHAGEPRAFYCVNSKTKERKKLLDIDEEMNGSQCLSLKDYQASEAWVANLKLLAEKRCK